MRVPDAEGQLRVNDEEEKKSSDWFGPRIEFSSGEIPVDFDLRVGGFDLFRAFGGSELVGFCGEFEWFIGDGDCEG